MLNVHFHCLWTIFGHWRRSLRHRRCCRRAHLWSDAVASVHDKQFGFELLFLIRNIVLSYSNDYKNPHKNWNKKKLFIYQQLSLELYPVIQIHDLTCDWHLFRFEYSFFRVPNNQLIGEDYPWLHPGVFLLKMCDSLSVRLIFWYFFRILRIN